MPEQEPGRSLRVGAAAGQDLQSFLDGELIQARPASFRRRLQRWARHRPRLASVLVTMFAFYVYHLICLAMGNPGSEGFFHWQATGHHVARVRLCLGLSVPDDAPQSTA